MRDIASGMEDADISVNIDTESKKVPPDLLSLGIAVTTLHEETDLRVTGVEMEGGDHPPYFRIEGNIISNY